MTLLNTLLERSKHQCELCEGTERLQIYTLQPSTTQTEDNSVLICGICAAHLDNPLELEGEHWANLNETMWSQYSPVKVLIWRTLNLLKEEGWPIYLLDMMFMEDEELAFAKAGLIDPAAPKHKDSNGNVLENGDSVVLVKDLDVKGSSLTAKRGTVVRNIRLDPDNLEYIEGKVDGQQIVILTKYVKKSNT